MRFAKIFFLNSVMHKFLFHCRVFDPLDRKQLLETVNSVCKSSFKCDLTKAFGKKIPLGTNVSSETMRTLIFGNFMEPDAEHKTYDEIDDWSKLEKIINYYLNEYNSTAMVPMNLNLFKYSIEHISRVSRALQIPLGHLIVIGNGGSGRKTSIKLVASMSGAELFYINCGCNYSVIDWREDLKKALFAAGLNGKNTIIVYPDPCHANAAEFMNNLITIMDNSDLPNLFQSEDKVKIMDAMQSVAKKLEKIIDTTPAALYKLFIDRIRMNLHIALVVSSVGDNWKRYFHCYPSLKSFCSVNYFMPWPEDALQNIAEKFIATMSLTHTKLSKRSSTENEALDITQSVDQNTKLVSSSQFEMSLVKLMIYFNDSVTQAKTILLKEYERSVYITPSLFMEMLNLFKIIYGRKHFEITQKRERYTTGLEKLDSAASQVGDMQKKLFDLQPELKKLSDETEQIMVTIERDTAEAEKKKEVVGADEATANEAAATAQAIKDDCDSDLQVNMHYIILKLQLSVIFC